jgi:hypothetical protein
MSVLQRINTVQSGETDSSALKAIVMVSFAENLAISVLASKVVPVKNSVGSGVTVSLVSELTLVKVFVLNGMMAASVLKRISTDDFAIHGV